MFLCFYFNRKLNLYKAFKIITIVVAKIAKHCIQRKLWLLQVTRVFSYYKASCLV